MSAESGLTRRQALAAMAAAAAPGPERLRVAVMSKFLQFLTLPEMAARAKEMGFDGIDLCVRPGAHVLPERVADDLPRAAETIRKAGLELPMITAGISDLSSPHAEAILKTAGALDIHYYRWGWFNYEPGPPIAAQLEALKPRVKELADANRQYNVCAMYHIHSGRGLVGGCVWDIWLLVKDLDPRRVGINYDIGHATVEGGYGGWLTTFDLVRPYLRGAAMKDFRWRKDAKGEWAPEWVPLGDGMVNFGRYLPMLKRAQFQGPVQLHFEYALGGVENGATKLSIPERTAFDAMRRDLRTLRGWMDAAQL